jgi:hypothetical protein
MKNIPERSLVAKTAEDLRKQGYSEGKIIRTLPEEFKKRQKIEVESVKIKEEKPVTPKPELKPKEKPIEKGIKIKTVLKEGIVDEKATKSLLPDVPKGHVRLFRAESPTVKFKDVFDLEKLTKSSKQGEYYTTNLKYADYFRATYGRDAYIKYIDLPENLAKKGFVGKKSLLLLSLNLNL